MRKNPFNLPFTDQDIEIFLLKINRPRQGMRRIDSSEMQAAKAFGGKLFNAVFDRDVRVCLSSSLDEAQRQGIGLRIRLRTTHAPELTDLPWEYLYNPTLNRFLARSTETPIVRYLEIPQRIQPLMVKPPLRALVMISSPYNYPKLDVEQEWRKLHEAFGDLQRQGIVILERLEKATPSARARGAFRLSFSRLSLCTFWTWLYRKNYPAVGGFKWARDQTT